MLYNKKRRRDRHTIAKNPKQVIGVKTARLQAVSRYAATIFRGRGAPCGIKKNPLPCKGFVKLPYLRAEGAKPVRSPKQSDGFGRKRSTVRHKKESFVKQRIRKTAARCDVVHLKGLEPSRRGHRILSPARLPIPPQVRATIIL